MDNPIDNRGEAQAKIIDQCEKEVEGFKDSDFFEYCDAYLSDETFELVLDAWRMFEPRNEIDGLLADLMLNPKNLQYFVSHLDLMEPIKKMVLEYLIDTRLNDSDWGY